MVSESSKELELFESIAVRNTSVLIYWEVAKANARNQGMHTVKQLILPRGSSCVLASSLVLRGLFLVKNVSHTNWRFAMQYRM